MKTFFSWLSTIALIIITCGAALFYYAPGLILEGMQAAAAHKSQLIKKQIDIDGYTAHYYEGGATNGKLLVLLHGLSGDKNSFVSSVSKLTQNYRVILPDLQAHGENAALQSRDHSIKGQVEYLDQLFKSINVRSFVIGGNSMGGHIATAYTARYPEKVKGLILVNATGVQLEDESTYEYFPAQVDRAFLKNVFAELFVTPPNFPSPIVDHMAEQLNERISFMNSLIKQVETGEYFRLNESLPNIQIPAMIVWGKQDPIVPVTYAERFNAGLAYSELKVFENVGHYPQFEMPAATQEQMRLFLEKVK